jgi:hypothetical protein
MHRTTCGLGALLLLFLASAPAAPQDEKKEGQDEFRRKTEKYKKSVTSLRGLEFKKDVTVGVYSKQELLDFLKEELDREFPREKAERFQRAYAKFGLLPEDMDLYDALMKLFGSSIAGFYHPKTKELRLIKAGEDKDPEAEALKAMGMDMEAITLVHELTHAAQDQNFELSTLPLEDETNDDLILAIKSAIEGDASMVGWKYALKERFEAGIGLINAQFKTGQLPGEAGSLPAYLRLSLTFPYGHGGDFALKCIKNSPGGLKDASKLLKDFPLSSEQILHPAKYFEERDNPILVTLPDLPKLFGAPWKESVNNVHGEFGIGLLLREFKGDDLTFADARRASEGWGGDRYVALEDDRKRVALVWYSTWDTEQDAREFFKAYAAALARRYSIPEEKRPEDPKGSFEAKGGWVHIERKGSDVLVLDGANPDMVKKLDAIWRGARKSELKGFDRLKLFVCEKDGVKEAFSGPCPKCGQELTYKDGKEPSKKPEKKKREY